MDWALERGYPLRLQSADGAVVELMYMRDGWPYYYMTHNVAAADSVSTDELWGGGVSGLSLDGSSVTVYEWDGGGVQSTHQEFGSRITWADNTTPDPSDHSTHVAGTLVASGEDVAAHGMAPNASLQAYDWEADSPEMLSVAVVARLSNHSYGYIRGWEENSDGSWRWYGDPIISSTEDARFGFYGDGSRGWDELAHNAPFYLIVKSAGNDRNDVHTGIHQVLSASGVWIWSTEPRDPDGGDSGYDTLGEKACAKNILTVGAVDVVAGGYNSPNDVTMSSFSSWGPTDDGRIKPDIVADGVSLYSPVAYLPGSAPLEESDSSYNRMSGTSMAAPCTTGSLALLIQHWRASHGGSDMTSATLKALTIHTADECGPHDGPDYQYGWGLLNTMNAANHITEDSVNPTAMQELNLPQAGSVEQVLRYAGAGPIKVTICWTDPPGEPVELSLDPPDRMLRNDLDLRITDPDGTDHFPWALEQGTPEAQAERRDNDRDNVEQVLIPFPGEGEYRIRVSHKGPSLMDGSQGFSIVMSGLTEAGVAPSIATVDFSPVDTTVSPPCVFGYVMVKASVVGGTPPLTVRLRVDNGDPIPLSPLAGNLYGVTWDANAECLGNHIVQVTATDLSGAQSSLATEVQVVESPCVQNVAPVIHIVSPAYPNEGPADAAYLIRWIDSDPDSNAIVELFWDMDADVNNNDYPSQRINPEPISEDDQSGDDFYTWDTSSMPNGSYYICAWITDECNPPVNYYSTGTVQVHHPEETNDTWEILKHEVDDDNPESDADGILESGETGEMSVLLGKISHEPAYSIRGYLSTNTPGVTITDDYVIYPNITIHNGISWGYGEFEFTTTPSFSDQITFTLRIEYRTGNATGPKYIEYETLHVTVHQPGTVGPQLQVDEVVIDDSEQGDGDGVLESGERAGFFVHLRNDGNAACIEPQGVIRQITACGVPLFGDVSESYPTINPGQTEVNHFDFDTGDIPSSCSGSFTAVMDVYYGCEGDLVQTVEFPIEITSASYMNLSSYSYDFCVVCQDDGPVLHNVTIINPGSADLVVSSIQTSDPDTSVNVTTPLVVPAGSSHVCEISVDTSSIPDGAVARTVTFVSDPAAHGHATRVFQITGTAYCGGTTSAYARIAGIPWTHHGYHGSYSNLAVGDTDNDGMAEIISATSGGEVGGVDYSGRLYVLELVADDTFELRYESPDLGYVPENAGLATGDFDGDGYTDICVLSSSGPDDNDYPWKVTWFEAVDNDSWTIRGTPVSQNSMLTGIEVGDSDGDGLLEIIVGRDYRQGATSAVQVYEYSGGGFVHRWTSPDILNPPNPFSDPTVPYAITVADSDGDGHPEILWATADEQIMLYESVGNNSYIKRLDYANGTYLAGSFSPYVDITVADTDGDSLNEIIYVSEEDYLFVLESQGNNVWNESNPENYLLPGGRNGLSVVTADVNNDGEKEIVVGMDGGGPNPNLVVYRTLADNSHVVEWGSPPGDVPYEAYAVAILDTNATPLPEILVGSEDINIIAYAHNPDIGVSPANMTTQPSTPSEDDLIEVTALVRNTGSGDASDVIAAFYHGHPESGGVEIGSPQSLGTIASGAEATVQQDWQPTEGLCPPESMAHTLCVSVETVGDIKMLDNIACTTIDVHDDDCEGPEISNITVAEDNGDGNSLLEDDETIFVSWEAHDEAGISETSCVLDGVTHPASGSYHVVLGPLDAGNHTVVVTATDADNSPESTESTTIQISIIPHAPMVISTTPDQDAVDVSVRPVIEVEFNVELDAGTVTQNTVTLSDSSNNDVPGVVAYGERVTFTPSTDLANSEIYTLVLSGGPTGIRDQNGNRMAESYALSFTTEPDSTSPMVQLISPEEGAGVFGMVRITGTSWDANLENYHLEYGMGYSPDTWFLLRESEAPVFADVLAEWNTVGLAPGTYTLRLVATDREPSPNSSQATTHVSVVYFMAILDCMTGPDPEYALRGDCQVADVDSDGDVDLYDFAAIQTLLPTSLPTCWSDTDCDDEDYCNGDETCHAGTCTTGIPPCMWNEVCDEDNYQCLPDCNTNGISDEDELASGSAADCNDNGVPDECDIRDGHSEDADGNGIPDECEAPAGELVIDLGGGVSMTLVRIEGGTFSMGSATYTASQPIHDVTIGYDYFIGNAEVTQEQWLAVMGDNPAHWTGDLQQPVDSATYTQCVNFCDQVSTITGLTVRMPSEAEWEYACRGGQPGDRFFTAPGTLDQYAWYDKSDGPTRAVKQGLPNPYGLYDVYGNVWEFCSDAWSSTYNGAPTDGSPRPGTGERTRRGGSWRKGDFWDSVYRDTAGDINQISNRYGFRVVAEVLLDCNANQIDDRIEIATGTDDDCNNNEVPDECDIESGTSEDVDENGIPDECEPSGFTFDADAQGWSVVSFPDMGPYSGNPLASGPVDWEGLIGNPGGCLT